MGRRSALGILLSLFACASAPSPRVPDPALAAKGFAEALRRDRPGDGYALLDPELRASVGRERFEQLWRENRNELLELGARFENTAAKATAHAHVELEDDERIPLVLEDGQWRISGGLLDAQALGTPIDAVVELRRALKRQSLPSLLRLLARERRAAWAAAFDKTIEQTSDALDLRVEVKEDEAIVHLTGGGEVRLKREGASWRVWDVK